MKWLCLFSLALSHCAVSGAAPRLTYSAGKVSVVMDPKMPAVKEKMEVLEQEHCPSSVQLRHVDLTSGCDFLRGLYRYAFLDRGKERTLFYEFSIFRSGSGHAFIAAAPLELGGPPSTN